MIIILLISLILLVIGLYFKLYANKNNQDIYKLETSLNLLKDYLERLERGVRDDLGGNRKENQVYAQQMRQEILQLIKSLEEGLLARMNDIANLQKNQLDIFSHQLTALTTINEEKLENMRKTIEERIRNLQQENSQKLEQMRLVVDEKLHNTLERRLGESFKLVSERLELVQQGLGQMQALATGVGDLKRVLVNVKTRGVWGEVQLGLILEQILTPEQFQKNVMTKKGSSERVDFAIKLPGKDGEFVWLPIDAKFPKEDYEKLIQAQEVLDVGLIEEAGKAIETRIKLEAKSIRDKYIQPPNTVDFAILFLPIEGLFAEVLRRPGLCDFLQREYRVAVSGPTTIAAFLNSLQMGFRTLAIEKRSSEVWQLLAAVKLEFEKFGDILDKTHKKIKEVSDTIENASRKSRTIQRKLKDVQALPQAEGEVLGVGVGSEPDNEDVA